MNEDIGARLNSLLSDPQSLGQLMNLVSGMMSTDRNDTDRAAAPIPEQNRQEPSFTETFDAGEPVFAHRSPPPSLSFTGGGDQRCELLKALKPYMRNERAGKIDLMIRVLQLSSVMKSSGLGLFERG